MVSSENLMSCFRRNHLNMFWLYINNSLLDVFDTEWYTKGPEKSCSKEIMDFILNSAVLKLFGHRNIFLLNKSSIS